MNTQNCCTCAEQLAIASIPKQEWCEPYDLCTAVNEGTLFPCLNLPFYKAPKDSGCQISCNEPDSNHLPDPQKAINKLTAITFAIQDLTLYLDTHPDCPKGTALFYQFMEQRLNLLASFANTHYPLTLSSMITGNCNQTHFGWSDGPMPWEGACI